MFRVQSIPHGCHNFRDFSKTCIRILSFDSSLSVPEEQCVCRHRPETKTLFITITIYPLNISLMDFTYFCGSFGSLFFFFFCTLGFFCICPRLMPLSIGSGEDLFRVMFPTPTCCEIIFVLIFNLFTLKLNT